MPNLPAEISDKKIVTMSPGSIYFDVAKFEHAMRVAKSLAAAKMIPEIFRDSLGDCLIAIDLAERLGASPFMVMQNTYMVHGKPGLEAKLVIALVNNCGRFSPIEYEEIGDLTKPANDEDGCIAYATDLKSNKVLRSVKVTWGMVKSEGWYGKNQSKWKSGLAPLMFRYRSAAFFARTFCPDVLLGMDTREELVDYVDAEHGADGSYSVPERNYRGELKTLINEASIDVEKAEVWLNHQAQVTNRDLKEVLAQVVNNWGQDVIDHIKSFDPDKAALTKRQSKPPETTKKVEKPPEIKKTEKAAREPEKKAPEKTADDIESDQVEMLKSNIKGMYSWLDDGMLAAIDSFGRQYVEESDDYDSWPFLASSLNAEGMDSIKAFLGEFNEHVQAVLLPEGVTRDHWRVMRFFQGGYGMMKAPGVEGFFDRMKAHIEHAPDDVIDELIYKWEATHKDGPACPISKKSENGAEGSAEAQNQTQGKTDTGAQDENESEDGQDDSLEQFQKWADSLPASDRFAIRKEAGLLASRFRNLDEAHRFKAEWEKLYSGVSDSM